MFNSAGFSKVLMTPNGSQGETNSQYAAVTQNEYDDNSGAPPTDFPTTDDSASASPTPDSPANSGSGFDIGGFITGVNSLGQAIAATSGNIAADIRVTKANMKAASGPATISDQFNAMPLIEKIAIGIAAFFVLRLAVHKMG